jgi:ornithine cyclodeaminase
MTPPFIPFGEGQAKLDWIEITDAIEAGHSLPRAEIGDTFLYRDPDTLLSRAAWIDGLGIAVKSATVFPRNQAKGKPNINGAVSLFSDTDGSLAAMLDFHLVTKWKTAGDSLLAARKLARPDSENILIVGAGTVAASLFEAYSAAFPKAKFTVWNRTRENAVKLADRLGISVADDLETAVRNTDILTSATMATTPFIKGDWFQPGQHIDLIKRYVVVDCQFGFCSGSSFSS